MGSPVVDRIFTGSVFERHRGNIPQLRVDQSAVADQAAAASQPTVASQSGVVSEPDRNEPTHGVDHYIQRMHAMARAWNARYNAGLHNLEGLRRDPTSVADLGQATEDAPVLSFNPSGHYLRSIYRDGGDVPLPPLPSEFTNSVVDQLRNEDNSNDITNSAIDQPRNEDNSNGSGSNGDNVANNNASS